jgi:hypothetical protein
MEMHGYDNLRTMAKQLMPLFGSIPARFETELSLEQSIERLQTLLKRSTGWDAWFRYRPVGKVKGTKVSLLALGPEPAWGPEFRGELIPTDQHVALSGGFAIPLPLRVYCMFFIAFSGLVAIVAAAAWLGGEPRAGAVVVAALIFMASFVLALRVYQHFLPGRIPWLATVITQTLAKDEAIAIEPLPVPENAMNPAIAFKVVVAVTLLLSAASAITGICAFYQDKDTQETRYVTYENWGRAVAAAIAMSAAIALVGLQRRTLLTWKCTLIGIAVFGLGFVFLVTGLMSKMPHVEWTSEFWLGVLCNGALMALLTAYMAVFWYKEKDLFIRDK